MKEDLVQFIWEKGLFDQSSLLTTDGQPIELLQKGFIQHGQGPDINGAMLRINGQLWGGTVEIHKRASEWYEHGHQNDNAYENVILHVVLENDVSARTVSGRKPPTLELKNRISEKLLAEHERIMHTSAWVPCENHISETPQAVVDTWLNQLLHERLERKTQEARSLLNKKGNDSLDAFYLLLLRSFGLKANVDACSSLAQTLPLSLLQKYRNSEHKLEALLFGTAGLLKINFLSTYARGLQKEFAYLQQLHKLKTIPLASWQFGRIRPSNFPTVRLALFASLIQKFDGDLSALLKAKQIDELHDLLSISAGKQWNNRYTLDEESSPKRKTLGRSMRNTIITNAIVPFHFAMGYHLQDERRVNLALQLLSQMPAASDRIVNTWQILGIENKTMGRSQALLELKNEYCNHRKCLNCSIGKLLMQKQVA